MKTIVLENITKKYSDSTIFTGLNFSVEKGEVVTILGKSGGGKSTLLRCICGLEKIDEGNITIMGEKIVDNGKYLSTQNSKEALKKVGMVFQEYNLFTNMTVEENVCKPALNQKVSSPEQVYSKYEQLMKDFAVDGNGKKYPVQLSGGQSQRVAIVRALMLNPEVILFDEPTSALDVENSAAFVECVNRLSAQGYTIIIVTHDTNLVDNLPSKRYTMVDGKLELA